MKLLSKSYCLKHYGDQYYRVTKPEYAELLIAQALMLGAKWNDYPRPSVWTDTEWLDDDPIVRMHLREQRPQQPAFLMEVLHKHGSAVNVDLHNYNKMLEQAHEKSNT